jgi:hypothetical protein
VWPLADAARVFLGTIVKYLTQRADEIGSAVFDKVRCTSALDRGTAAQPVCCCICCF